MAERELPKLETGVRFPSSARVVDARTRTGGVVRSVPALKPKARTDLTFVQIEDEAILYDPESVRLHHLNHSAALIFQLCDGSGTVEELARDIADELGLPEDDILKQVQQVVGHFEHSGILSGQPKRTEEHVHG
jgi:PqqD family protein of HPr-rel-A system